MRRLRHQFLRYIGCVEGKRAYTGPLRAEIYLTNKCNLDCIACWTFSPLLKGTNRLEPVEIAWPRAEALIRDLARGGCEEVLFVGGGEPMIYPRIMEALELVKSLGMACFVTTNMTPVTEKRVERMIDIGLDRLYVSLWAATPETYDLTHPNASGDDFRKIDRILRHFRNRKRARGSERPAIVIHNVIFNRNSHEVRAMAEYAFTVGADAVQFTTAYTFPDRTDVLLLNEAQRASVLDQVDSLPAELRERRGLHGPGTFLWEIENFRRRVEERSAAEGEYDGSILDRIPCQIGWFYTIIRANGDVIPCCKGNTRVMGNIHGSSFAEIWNGETYDEFRDKAKHLPKSDPYFEPIACHKMCDNLGHLMTIEKQMERLRVAERFVPIALPVVRATKRTSGQ